MEMFAKFIGGSLLVVAGLFFVIILGTAMGALSGWVVGLIFSSTLLAVMNAIGIHGVAVWQFGAFLGFVGSFFRTSNTTSD